MAASGIERKCAFFVCQKAEFVNAYWQFPYIGSKKNKLIVFATWHAESCGHMCDGPPPKSKQKFYRQNGRKEEGREEEEEGRSGGIGSEPPTFPVHP